MIVDGGTAIDGDGRPLVGLLEIFRNFWFSSKSEGSTLPPRLVVDGVARLLLFVASLAGGRGNRRGDKSKGLGGCARDSAAAASRLG